MTLPETLSAGLLAQDRRALARAITLVESTKPSDRVQARALMGLLPAGRQALRLGITGTPGVGKSTFIESFGLMLAEQGLRLAVVAVDPSSALSGGSILGDKTRMERLSRHPMAFIRPSPSQAALGGVARRTRDVVTLFEAAGYDAVLIETVGVGQSETLVADLCDIFLLLIAPGGGDELQGVKRGIMELADLIVVNKADGDLLPAARRTAADYQGALALIRRPPGDAPGFPAVQLVSALDGTGLAETWGRLQTLARFRRDHGLWTARRRTQAARALTDELRLGLEAALSRPPLSPRIAAAAARLAQGQSSAEAEAEAILSSLLGGMDNPANRPEYPPDRPAESGPAPAPDA